MNKTPMNKHYDATLIEGKWYAWWEARGLFHADASRGGEPYCVVIPPPNVTGILHMGHALNNTIQDILVRWRRMQGRNVLWMPGTDHAGIATQNVVERALRAEGRTRQELGREAFLERVWAWREQYGNTITGQLKRLGASCDWERERFTMDEGLSAAVIDMFCRLYEQGLIYRGNYIVNWCPRCHTALSDEESEHRPVEGHLYHIRYPLDEGGQVVVATTRPETLLGDVAVAVHPDDERYRDLTGKTVRLPIIGRALTVIRDNFVDPAFGTGVVKVTPAHDPNDFEMARRHGLEPLNIMNGDGTLNEQAGPYAGRDRFAARKQLLADLETAGLLEKIVPHSHAVGHCYRCDTLVEPRLSAQWFVKMAPLAKPAMEAVRSGQVSFVPSRWEKVYLDWMENIRDWCISRQIWWGHRIPVFTCGGCKHEWAARTTPEKCPACGQADAPQQDEDVLDTWFSSWLWPFSTLGWPEDNEDLRFYYPTHDLVTASEIIFFWVARMVMAGLDTMGAAPFRRVHIHGTVRDEHGLKMSKSLGNSIDPLTIIERFSADALRFSLMMITATGQDVFLSDDKFEIGRNFGTKLWNAARFMRRYMDAVPDEDWTALSVACPDLNPELLRDADRYLLARTDECVRQCSEHLEAFRFQDYAMALYGFIRHEYCDWYIESSKPDLTGGDDARRDQVLRVMSYAVSTALRLLHPVMPFLTEELWHELGYGDDESSIMRAPWPSPPTERLKALWGVSAEVTAFVEARHDMIRAGRQLRAEYGLAPTRKVRYVVRCSDAATQRRLAADTDTISSLLNAEILDIVMQSADANNPAPSAIVRLGVIEMPLEGLVDVAAETERLTTQRTKVADDLLRVQAKLSNDNFVSRAPDAVVEQQRARREELLDDLKRLDRMMTMLQSVGKAEA